MTTGDFDPNAPLDDFRASAPIDDFNPSGGFGPSTTRSSFETPSAPPGNLGPPVSPFADVQSTRPRGGLEPASTAHPSFDPNAPLEQGYRPDQKFGGGPAPLGLRFAARLIDGVACAIISIVISGFSSADDAGIVEFVALGAVAFTYFVAFEGIVGWTPGKKLLGLSVRGPKGASKPTLGQAVARNVFLLWLLIPYAGILIVIIPCIRQAMSIVKDVDGEGVFDKRAGGTRVIKD
jgi:hypothetical protein